MCASYGMRGGGRFWLSAILGVAVTFTLCSAGFAQGPPPLSGDGDPTNDLPGTLHDFTSTSPVPEYALAPDGEGCIACHAGPDLNHDPSDGSMKACRLRHVIDHELRAQQPERPAKCPFRSRRRTPLDG